MDRQDEVAHYVAQAEKQREKFNKGLAKKDLQEGSLVLKYDYRFDIKKDKKFLHRWEGPFVTMKKYSNHTLSADRSLEKK